MTRTISMHRVTPRSARALCALCLHAATTSANEPERAGWVYHPDFLLHDAGTGHPERRERPEAIVEHLESQQLLARLVPIAPIAVDEAWLRAVHARE